MATLYIRDVPPELYEQIKGWAAKSGRSVNGEVVTLLQREAERRGARGEWLENLLTLRKELALNDDDVDFMIRTIREHRDGLDDE